MGSNFDEGNPFIQFIFQHVSFVADIHYFPRAFHFKLLKEFLKQYKKQFMHLIRLKRSFESMVSNFEERKTICCSFSSIMSVLSQICNTFEVNFKKNTQIVLKQSKQQFMYLISPKELLSRWVPTLKREQPFAKQ